MNIDLTEILLKELDLIDVRDINPVIYAICIKTVKPK